MNLPSLKIEKIFHIGTLNPSDLGINSGKHSLEGNCLSISLSPNAWQQIAKLGGYHLHELRKAEAVFIDIHEVRKNGDLDKILEWATDQELVVLKDTFKVWMYDSETDDWTYTFIDNEKEAHLLADPDGEYDKTEEIPGPEDRFGVAIETIYVGTPKLEMITGIMCSDNMLNAFDAAIIAYARDHTAADGVWWWESYEPDNYSAPRGAVFPDKVASWSANLCNFEDVDDYDELARLEESIEIAKRYPHL